MEGKRGPVCRRRTELLSPEKVGERGIVETNLSRVNTNRVCGLRLGVFVALAVIAGLSASPAPGQTTSTWTAGAGNWEPCPNQQGTALWDTCNANPPVFPNGNFNAVIQGGPVTMGPLEGAGIVNLSLASGDSLTITPGYLEVDGPSIVNNGSISIGLSNGLIIGGVNVNTTLSGSGTVNLIDPNAKFWGASGTGSGLIIQQPVSGQGYLGFSTLGITNQSKISASGGTLTIQPNSATGLTNTGTMEATSGTTLDLIAGFSTTPFNNTGGTIEALDGGKVQLNAGTFTGGTFTTTGTGSIQTLSVMNSITNSGLMTIPAPTGPTTTFEGTITNTSAIQSLGTIYISGPTTLSGAGNFKMSGPSAFLQALGSASDALTNHQMIHGSGGIYALSLTNQGAVNADDTTLPLTISAQFTGGTPTTNKSLLEASGGATLQIEDYVNNSGGTIEAQTGSTVLLTSGASINGGTLTTAGTGVIETQNPLLDGRLNIPTNAGMMHVASGTSLNVKGTINNTGTIALDPVSFSCIALNAATTFTGTGQITMNGPSNCFLAGAATDTLTNSSTISGFGSIGDSNPMTVTNKGTIVANGGVLTIVGAGAGFTNGGKLYVNPGASMNITGFIATVFRNFKNNTLSGGIYSLAGPLSFPNANVVTRTGNLTLAGPAGAIVNSSTSTNALANFAVNKGPLSLTLGQNLITVTSLTNSSTVIVDKASSLTLAGSYTQTAGKTTIDGTLTVPSGLHLNAGTLFGAGTIAGSLTSSAAVTAGDSATKTGKLSVQTYTQNATGVLNISIRGLTLGSQYGQLASANGVSLAGKLSLTRLSTFVPAIGSSFTIVAGSAVTGHFTTVTGLSINASEHFQVNYTSNAVTVTVVSGP